MAAGFAGVEPDHLCKARIHKNTRGAAGNTPGMPVMEYVMFPYRPDCRPPAGCSRTVAGGVHQLSETISGQGDSHRTPLPALTAAQHEAEIASIGATAGILRFDPLKFDRRKQTILLCKCPAKRL